jgi:thiosulfate dehydrogenase [quinone] large subunit
LTVSWNTDPYYYGSDLGFAVAFLTLALAGPVRWSLDAWLASAGSEGGAGESRRLLLKRAAATGITGGAALLGAAGAGKLGRSGGTKQNSPAPVQRQPQPESQPSAVTPAQGQPRSAGPATAPSGGLEISVAAIPATGAAQLTAPGGDPIFVARTADGGYKACSGICTHAGCPVGVDQAKGVLACPCHGSTFDPKTGAVITGPAKDPLPSFPVTVADGVLRVQKA